MNETVNPYLCVYAPIWRARVRDINYHPDKQQEIERVTLAEAKSFVENRLNEYYPDGWELENQEGDWGALHYGTRENGRLHPAVITVMEEFTHEWGIYRGRGMRRTERMDEKAEEMYELLRILAPMDERVLAIMSYVETDTY